MRIDKTPDVFGVMFAVDKLNKCKKGTSEYEIAHKEAVKQVRAYNGFYGKDWSMSISKARCLIQDKYSQDKTKAMSKAAKEAKKKAKDKK